jgi:hypothetical protein
MPQYPVVRLPKHLLKNESFPWPEKLLRIVLGCPESSERFCGILFHDIK